MAKLLDLIPEDIILPDPMTMVDLARLYKFSLRTLQRDFQRLQIIKAIGEKRGHYLSTTQLLIIFYLYHPPVKYYRHYLWLEQRGYIEWIVKKHCSRDYLKQHRG